MTQWNVDGQKNQLAVGGWLSFNPSEKMCFQSSFLDHHFPKDRDEH